MKTLVPGSTAPPLPGVDFSARPTVLFFYKVTCPVCQMAAPAVAGFETAYAGHVVGIGQDPRDSLDDFAHRYGMNFPSLVDGEPYRLSNAYGVRVVPTAFLVATDGVVLDSVESWDRDGLNSLSAHLAELIGADYRAMSEEGDGLPAFRPG